VLVIFYAWAGWWFTSRWVAYTNARKNGQRIFYSIGALLLLVIPLLIVPLGEGSIRQLFITSPYEGWGMLAVWFLAFGIGMLGCYLESLGVLDAQ
jgi:hypothetical protein